MSRQNHITVTYMPAMIRIDGIGKMEFKMDEITEELGRVMTPHLFEISTSTHYGRMVMTDDNTVMLFGDMNEMMKYISDDGCEQCLAGLVPARPTGSANGEPCNIQFGREKRHVQDRQGRRDFRDRRAYAFLGRKPGEPEEHPRQAIHRVLLCLSLQSQSAVGEVGKGKFEKYDAKTMFDDLFVTGYDDMAILQPTYLTDFYKNGFNTTERNAAMKKSHPDRFILNGAFDPRDGNKGLEHLHELSEKYKIKGVKLYTAEWRGESKGYKLSDKPSYQYLEAAQKLGIKNIHVHKGPTIIPLNRDAFDVADIDDCATSFQDLNFIVEHCGLPRLDDFCWIATQETNVYAGLAVALPFIHTRPGYFAHVISELLFWVGPDKISTAATTASGRRNG